MDTAHVLLGYSLTKLRVFFCRFPRLFRLFLLLGRSLLRCVLLRFKAALFRRLVPRLIIREILSTIIYRFIKVGNIHVLHHAVIQILEHRAGHLARPFLCNGAGILSKLQPFQHLYIFLGQGEFSWNLVKDIVDRNDSALHTEDFFCVRSQCFSRQIAIDEGIYVVHYCGEFMITIHDDLGTAGADRLIGLLLRHAGVALHQLFTPLPKVGLKLGAAEQIKHFFVIYPNPLLLFRGGGGIHRIKEYFEYLTLYSFGGATGGSHQLAFVVSHGSDYIDHGMAYCLRFLSALLSLFRSELLDKSGFVSAVWIAVLFFRKAVFADFVSLDQLFTLFEKHMVENGNHLLLGEDRLHLLIEQLRHQLLAFYIGHLGMCVSNISIYRSVAIT